VWAALQFAEDPLTIAKTTCEAITWNFPSDRRGKGRARVRALTNACRHPLWGGRRSGAAESGAETLAQPLALRRQRGGTLRPELGE
jgi:hypothetical protein